MKFEEIYAHMAAEYKTLAGVEPEDAADVSIRLKVLAGELYTVLCAAESLKLNCFPQTATGEALMLDHEGGKSMLLTEEKIDKIKHLTGTSWDVIGQGMMLKSNRPLVVFEGKTDVKYVKRAIDLLKNDNPSYDQLQVDFMSAGGADNMQFFITDLLEVIPNSKKVIVFFDRDNEGQTGAATLLNLTTSDEAIAHYDDVKQNNLTVSFIPYKTGVTGGDFLIEDYFSWDKTVKPMVDKAIENSHHPFKNLPKLSSRIKKGLEDKHMTFAKEEFEGFITLLDKIVKLSTEEGT